MILSRIEMVMAAIEQALIGMESTGYNVTRRRGNRWPDDVMSCIEIEQGSLLRVEDESQSISDVVLSFTLVINCKTIPSDELAESLLNKVSAEAYAVLMSNGQDLGLPYVSHVEWIGDDEPDIDSAEYKHGRVESEYRVQFSHSYASRAE